MAYFAAKRAIVKGFWAASLVILPAQAGAIPVFLPQQDVTIHYELTAPNRPAQDFQVSYQAAQHVARVDDAAHGVSYLADLNSGQVQILVPMLRAVVAEPQFSRFAGLLETAGGAQFTPLGHSHYAGIGCDTYSVTNQDGTGTACLTPDGEILHFHGHDSHGSATITAVSVHFGTVPADDFAVPAGYNEMQLPPGMLEQLLGG
jgi:hypothetical protein